MHAGTAVRRFAIALLAVMLAACSAQRLGHRRPGEDAVLPVDVTLSTSEIATGWQRDGDYLVSPALEEEAAASRVGVLVQLAAEGEFPPFEARSTENGEATGDWVPLATTYSEGDHHVGLADLGTISTGAQLRIPVDAVDNIASLVWNATIPDEIEDGEPAPDDTAAAVAPLTADLAGLGIVTRSAWGAVATRCTTRDAHRYRMAVHYTDTGSSNPDAQMRSIQHYHMDTRGWCDIGYHFLVGIDGRIFEGRPVELLGAHVSGNNTGNIGVSFIGCFHSTGCASMGPTTPPDVMLQAGGRLLGTLSRLYSISLDRTSVKGHRDHTGASTDCPGDYLYARIDQLLSIGSAHSLGDGTTMPPDPTPMPTTPASCGGLTCGPCAAAAGCGYCASQGACLSAGSTCTWAGSVGASECTDTLYPCTTATCWNPTATFTSCGSYTHGEDFTSGSYSVHRYWAHLYPGGVTTITLARTSGTFNPAILISDRSGRVAYGGEVAALHPAVNVVSAHPGRGDSSASVSLTATSDLDVYVYVTDWSVLDAGFRGRVPTSAHYSLSATEACSSTMPTMPAGSDPYAGLTQSGAEIPRAGLTNPTLRSTLGLSTEPYGTVVDYGGRSWVSGRVSWFGGPSDTGVGPSETVAISGEVARSLNSPLHPDAATLAAHPERYYYLAMRFSYSPMSTSFWRTARLIIANPRTGTRVVVRPADWGPNTSTGRIMDLSPQTIADLGLTTDDTAVIAFAMPGTALGVVH